MILSREHIDAATKPERDIIVNWLRDTGVDVERLVTFELTDAVLTVTSLPTGVEPPEVVSLVTVVFPVVDAPQATIHDLWARVAPVETDADLRVRDALVDLRDRYS